MSLRFPFVLALALSCLPLSRVSAHDNKKATAVFNKVALGVAGGHLEALDELKTLDYDDACAALLVFFRQNYNVMRVTTQTNAFAARTAQLASEIPDSEVYFRGLFKNVPGDKIPNWLANQKEDAIHMLVYMKKKMAVRVMVESLSDPNIGTDAASLAKGLADMNIKGAPYSNKTRQQAMTPEGLTNWKEWYETNKASFAAPAPTAPTQQ